MSSSGSFTVVHGQSGSPIVVYCRISKDEVKSPGVLHNSLSLSGLLRFKSAIRPLLAVSAASESFQQLEVLAYLYKCTFQ